MYACIDVGGTKTLIASFTKKGELRQKSKFPTPEKYDDFIAKLGKALQKLDSKDYNVACIALPGKIDRDNGVGIAFGNLPWHDVPIAVDLEKLLHCPVIVENDANLAGLSEALLVKDTYKRALYVTVSTGIGSIYVVDGQMDPSTLDAEVGHLLLEHNGSLMRWEEFASGKAIVKRFGKRASDIDKDDRATWYTIAHNLAVGMIDLIATYTPDVIIIGGGVGTHLPKFQDQLLDILKIYENPLLRIPPIISAQNPEEAVIHGCYELIRQRYETD